MKTIFKKVFFFAVAGTLATSYVSAAPKPKAAPAEKAVKTTR